MGKLCLLTKIPGLKDLLIDCHVESEEDSHCLGTTKLLIQQ